MTILMYAIASVIVLCLLFLMYWVLTHIFPLIPGQSSKQVVQKRKKERKPNTQQKEPDSLGWVKEQYPDALVMDTQTLVKEFRSGRRNFQNIYPTAVGPYETFLKWTNLDGIDLSRAMLYKAPFDGTSLVKANFNGASLEGASFRGAILRSANLSWVDLTGADLNGADLTGANLSYATLNGADLSNAIMVDTIVTTEQLEVAHSLKGAIMPDGNRHI
jgi:hypothetical protein